jgi:uncharacterized protein
MRKVIDLECDLPPDENGNPRKLEAATHPPGYGDPERLPPLEGHGFSNYARIFTRRADGAAGTEAEPQRKSGMSIADFIGMMDRAGVEIGVLRAGNAIITDILAQYPKRFLGLASISPHDGMRGVRELVRLVQECTLAPYGCPRFTTWFLPAIGAITRYTRNALNSTSRSASTPT